jgi:hypothetical protein
MSDKIKCTIDVDVNGVLSFQIPRTITVESYAKMEAEIPNTESRDVSLPANASTFQFLLISSNVYGSGVTYGDGTDTLELTGPILLFGGQIAGALSNPSLTNTIRFTNNSGGVANIQIIIGLNVVTEP